MPLSIASVAGVFALMAFWGGTTRPGPLFAAGVAVLAGIFTAICALGWWLFFSPLPGARPAGGAGAQAPRLLLSMVGVISGGLFIVGGLWDQLWHVRYGAFGQDFLWPPHLMLYGSIGLIALTAGSAMATLLRDGGGLRQRFRREPLIGLQALVAGAMVLSLPSDELWHRIYGLDLTAWSLPHLLMVAGTSMVMVIYVACQLSLLPLRGWRGLGGLRLQELLAVATLGWALLMQLQIGTVEWEGLHDIRERATAQGFAGAFWDRPEWLFPVIVATVSLFIGNLALHTFRRAGAATLVALFALGVRLALQWGLADDEVTLRLSNTPHLIALAAMLALDLWYAARLRLADRGSTQLTGNLVGGAALLVAGLPLIAATMPYPSIDASTLPAMVGFSLLMALLAGGVGAQFGGWLADLDRAAQPAPAQAWLGWAAAGALAIALLFTLTLVLTATPPTISG